MSPPRKNRRGRPEPPGLRDARRRAEVGFSCPIIGCENSHSAGHIMCGTCWGTVPAYLKPEIYRAWEKRQQEKTTEAILEHERLKDQAISDAQDARFPERANELPGR
jgi:hypothetical protein